MKTLLPFWLLLLLPVLLSGQLEKEIEAYLTEINTTNEVPGSAVAILKGDKVIYEGYFGLAEMNHRVQVSEKTLFRVYSSTKLIVSVALFQLVDAGKITMADPIGKHLPDLPATWQTRKIRDLVAHASGLPDFRDMKEGSTEGEAIEQLSKVPLYFPAGERFNYNQTNYWLLARIIEKTSGKLLDDFVRDGQFEGDASSFVFSSEALRVVPNRAGKYRYSSAGWALSGDSAGKIGHAANGLAITLPGLIGWAKRLNQGRLLGAAAGAEMVSEYPFSNPNDKFLHGWGKYPVNGQASRGFTGGGVSAFRYFPAQDLTVILLSNGSRYGIIHNRVVNHLAGMMDATLVDPAAVHTEFLNRLFIRTEDGAEAIRAFKTWRKDHPGIDVEDDLNSIGYTFARGDRAEYGLAIFFLNTELYPEAWNVWDSLGEGHEMIGQTEEALKYYKKSVELNPENTHGVEKSNNSQNNNKMKKLAKREAQIMQAIWRLEKAFIKEVVDEMPDPKPHYNSVSTMVKLLEKKGFVSHEKMGNAHRYFAVVRKEDYQEEVVDDVVKGFFDDSPMKLVNYFAKEQKLSEADVERLLKMIKDQQK